jgi:hypothetical protein
VKWRDRNRQTSATRPCSDATQALSVISIPSTLLSLSDVHECPQIHVNVTSSNGSDRQAAKTYKEQRGNHDNGKCALYPVYFSSPSTPFYPFTPFSSSLRHILLIPSALSQPFPNSLYISSERGNLSVFRSVNNPICILESSNPLNPKHCSPPLSTSTSTSISAPVPTMPIGQDQRQRSQT